MTGRGITELYNVDVKEIDILTVSMAHALASVGGLCVGTTEVRRCRFNPSLKKKEQAHRHKLSRPQLHHP